MKLKINLKNIDIVGFFKRHIEKIIASIALFILLWMIWGAIGRERISAAQEPKVLDEKVRSANTHIAQSVFDASKDLERQTTDSFEARAKFNAVSTDAYAFTKPFNEPPFELKIPRTSPVVHSVSDLRVSSGSAMFALAPLDQGDRERDRGPAGAPPGGVPLEQPQIIKRTGGYPPNPDDRIVVRPWVLITGLIPLRKQFNEYRSAFEKAVGYIEEQDVPTYRNYIVERAEVTSKDPKDWVWIQVEVKKNREFVNQWAGDAPQELVQSDYLFEPFAMRLGPRIGADWEESVGHSPEIPFSKAEEQHFGPGGVPPGLLPRGGTSRRPPVTPEGDEDVSETGEPGVGDGPSVHKPSQDSESSQKLKEVVARFVQRTGNSESEKPAQGIDQALFRFFDFTVETGKAYVYRVRLVLENPNYGRPPQDLAEATSARSPTVQSEFSDPTLPIQVAYGDQLLAGKYVDPENESIVGPGVMMVRMDEQKGRELSLLRRAEAGLWLQFWNTDLRSVDPRNGEVHDDAGKMQTDATLIDVRGGRPFNPRDRSLLEPTELLLVDRQGKLVVVNEFDDAARWKDFVVTEERAAPKNPGQPPGGGGLFGSGAAPKPNVQPKVGPKLPKTPPPAKAGSQPAPKKSL